MVDAQTFREQAMLRRDHVVITVFGKPCPQSVARFGRLAVANIVRNHEVKPRNIERLAGAVEFTGKFGALKLRTRAGRAVKNQDGIVYAPLGIALRRTERPAVHPQLRQGFAGAKAKVAEYKVALLRSG